MNGQGLLRLSACALLLSIPWVARAVSPGAVSPDGARGSARSANFLVHAPSDALAQEVVQRAERLRREIAFDWLGAELPQAAKLSLIHIKIDAQQSVGRTLPTQGSGGNLVWITSSEEAATGALLSHEILHTVVADRFGRDFPAWANEGLASRYDSRKRQRTRDRILRDAMLERLWPNLAEVMEGEVRTQLEYTAAASLTQFLLERGTPAQFLQFSEAGKLQGWSVALESYYAIAGTRQLQQQWQRWVVQQRQAERIALR